MQRLFLLGTWIEFLSEPTTNALLLVDLEWRLKSESMGIAMHHIVLSVLFISTGSISGSLFVSNTLMESGWIKMGSEWMRYLYTLVDMDMTNDETLTVIKFVLSFAIAYIAQSLTVLICHLFHILVNTHKWKKLRKNNQGFISLPLLSTSAAFTAESIIKYFLTAADKLAFVSLGVSNVDKGVYKFVSDLGLDYCEVDSPTD